MLLNRHRLIEHGLDIASGAFILLALGANLSGYKVARIAFLLGGLPPAILSIAQSYKADEKDPFIKIDRQARIEAHADLRARQIEGTPITPQLPAAENSPRLYQWENALHDACGLIIAGQPGYGKSTLALYFLGLFTQQQTAYIKVLDPHGRINHWDDHGLEVTCDFDQIESELGGAIAELDRRRQMSRGELNKEPAYIYVADEISACLDSFENPKLVSKALRRLGCEGRKYNVSLIAIAHSHNASALGIDAKQRSNYLLVLLGDSARQVAEQSWKKDSPEYQYVAGQAYPCMVSGSVRDMPGIHPTHGHHDTYRKQGNAPKNLLPINQIGVNQTDSNTDNNQVLPNLNQWRSYLENMPTLPANPNHDGGETGVGDFSPAGESENEVENPQTQAEQAFSPTPKPDQNPSDGCVRGGDGGGGESFTLDEASKVLALRKTGKTKPEIITVLSGKKPGKSKIYEAGKTKYEAIEAYWQNLDLWG